MSAAVGTEQLDLWAVMARTTDPDTSHDAAAQAVPRKHTDQQLVLRIHAHFPDGLTDFELADIADRQQTSLGVRRAELRDMGLVERTDLRRPSPSGSPAIVWRITRLGLERVAS